MTAPHDHAPAIPDLASHVRHQLEEMLNAPEWRQGGRLPAEAELAAQLGVSRPTLRKALADLREAGRIIARRGSGNFVQPMADVAAPTIRPSELTIRTVFDMKRCLQFRQTIECAAAEEAALQHDPAAIEALFDAHRQLVTLAPGAEIFEADFAFHIAVAHASRNPYFPFALETIRDQIRISVTFTRKLQNRPMDEVEPRVVAEHLAIAEAVQSGDPEAAREAMRFHMDQGRHRLLRE